jgi:regulator of nonsense transcripts 1
VSLSALSIKDVNKQPSYNQSDRLKRYVEGGVRPGDAASVFGGSSASMRAGRPHPGTEDDDARSVSTAFASQVGGNYD